MPSQALFARGPARFQPVATKCPKNGRERPQPGIELPKGRAARPGLYPPISEVLAATYL